MIIRMHIADAVVSYPVLIGGTVAAAGGVAMGLRRLSPDRMPQAALVSTMFFVAALIHIPLGPAQLHLVLNGLAGLLLGWAVFPAVLIALLLQAVMFGYGGVTVLGVNTCVMAIPGLVTYLLLHRTVQRTRSKPAAFAIGAVSGIIGIGLSSLLLASALLFSGDQFREMTLAIMLANIPLMVIEAAVTGSIVSFLMMARPEIFKK